MKKLILVFLLISLVRINAQYKWIVVSKMPYPVWGGQLAYDLSSQGTKIYILGGFSDSLQKPVNWIQEYDVVNNKWRFVGHMLQARSQFVADVWNGNIMYFGDSLSNTTKMESWNSRTIDTVSTVFGTNDNFGRSFSTGHIVGNIFYIIGGSPPSKTSLPYIVGYDLNSKQVVLQSDEITSDLNPKQHMSFVVGDNIYIFGGATIGINRTISRFNIPNRILTQLSTSLIENRAAGAAVYNTAIQKGFIIGGYKEGQDSILASVEQVIINSDGSINVTAGPSLNYARKNLMAVNYKGAVAVFGGQDKDGKVVPYVELLKDTSTTDVKNSNATPLSFTLFQNFPNPFNPSTEIMFQLNKASNISLDIYSVLGQHVVTLASGEYNSGIYKLQWNGLNKFNNLVPSGIYFLRLRAGGFVQTQKMVLLK